MKTILRIAFITFCGVYAVLITGCMNNGEKPDGSGTIECTQVQVAPQVSGKIEKIFFDEGDEVKEGALVARIDKKDYQLRVEEARNNVKLAQAQLDLILAGSRAEDIEAAKEKVREAKAALDLAEADFRRIEQVYKSGSATQKQYDDAKAAAERARAVYAAAEQNLARLQAGARKEEIEVAKAQVELAKSRLSMAEKALSDCEIFSPISGVVTTKTREDGEIVAAGMPILTISKLDEVWLSVYVPEPRLADVKLGDEAFVKVDGHPELLKGKVTFISPIAEFTPRNVQTPEERAKLVYRVKITLPNKNRILKPGMPADGYLKPPSKTN
jgi:HlyD family secretion protein